MGMARIGRNMCQNVYRFAVYYVICWFGYKKYSSSYAVVSRVSSVRIATRYRLDSPGIESR